MNVVQEKVITAIEDGWITFADPADPTQTFRKSIEVHLMMNGRKGAVGDKHKFQVSSNLEGKKFYLYDHEPPKKT